MSREKLFIGFDGGGTKISACARTMRGEIVCGGRLEVSGNISTAGGAGTADNFLAVIKNFGLQGDIAFVTAAVAGFSNETERGFLADRLNKMLAEGTPVFIMPDYAIFFSCRWDDFSRLIEEPAGARIIAIAGTGSVIFGRSGSEWRELPAEARAYGYGPLISDPGSSFDIGQRFVKRFLIEKETGKASPEIFEILKKHGLIDPLSPSGVAFDAKKFQASLASYAPAMIDAASAMPESVYYREVCEAAENFAAGIRSVARKISSPRSGAPTEILFNGGLILNSEFYRNIVLKKIEAHGPGRFEYFFAPSDVSPICALYSIKKYKEASSGNLKGDVLKI